jgi:hypothetical protein
VVDVIAFVFSPDSIGVVNLKHDIRVPVLHIVCTFLVYSTANCAQIANSCDSSMFMANYSSAITCVSDWTVLH